MMSRNPFEFEAANNLTTRELLDYYIEDFNYSRFLDSKRNIFLLGERGSGKTMTLLYHSFKVKYQDSRRNDASDLLDNVGVHIPCNTPLFHKKEYLLLDDDHKAQIIAEHYFVIAIVNEIILSLSLVGDAKEAFKPFDKEFLEEIGYIFNIPSRSNSNFLDSVRKWIGKIVFNTQKHINQAENIFYEEALSLGSFLLPLIKMIKQVPLFSSTHFSFLMDDAHDLNIHQIKVLNSWIAYRDHSDFSVKLATTKVNKPIQITTTGGSILEGHDFTIIDLEKPYFNKDSDFGKLARQIIKKRLLKINNLDIEPEDFFPTSKEFEAALEKYKEIARIEAVSIYGHSDPKKITDHVYKYSRAYYFRERAKSKANLVPYSGFSMLVDLSTGIIRNLLDPCYYMYDAVVSEASEPFEGIHFVPPHTQREVILNRSNALWKRLENGLEKEIEGCSEEQGKMILQLIDNIVSLFRERLLHHKSEPRAIMFSISEVNDASFVKLIELLRIAQMSQLLYTRTGVSKDDGKKDTYYILNRMFLPTRGLDPNGQHARVSIKSKDLWNAAKDNKSIPYSKGNDNSPEESVQPKLF